MKSKQQTESILRLLVTTLFQIDTAALKAGRFKYAF